MYVLPCDNGRATGRAYIPTGGWSGDSSGMIFGRAQRLDLTLPRLSVPVLADLLVPSKLTIRAIYYATLHQVCQAKTEVRVR